MKDFNNNNEDKMIKIQEISETKKININDDNSDIYDNILENQIQKRAFLTNIPSNIEMKQKLNELKHLKDRKKSLIKKINLVKDKKNEMDKISFNNIEKYKIDNNMLINDKKKINSLEQNLIDKLNEIKQQIKTLDKKEDENLKEKSEEKIKLNKENKKFDESIIKEQFLNQNRIRLKEIENKYKNMQKELLFKEKILEDKNRDIDDFGRLLDRTWRLKRQTGGAITTDSIDALYEKGIAAGALGGKLLGAGGGGFLVFYANDDKRNNVMKVMSDLLYVPFEFEDGGTQVIHYTPETYEPKELL